MSLGGMMKTCSLLKKETTLRHDQPEGKSSPANSSKKIKTYDVRSLCLDPARVRTRS